MSFYVQNLRHRRYIKNNGITGSQQILVVFKSNLGVSVRRLPSLESSFYNHSPTYRPIFLRNSFTPVCRYVITPPSSASMVRAPKTRVRIQLEKFPAKRRGIEFNLKKVSPQDKGKRETSERGVDFIFISYRTRYYALELRFHVFFIPL